MARKPRDKRTKPRPPKQVSSYTSLRLAQQAQVNLRLNRSVRRP